MASPIGAFLKARLFSIFGRRYGRLELAFSRMKMLPVTGSNISPFHTMHVSYACALHSMVRLPASRRTIIPLCIDLKIENGCGVLSATRICAGNSTLLYAVTGSSARRAVRYGALALFASGCLSSYYSCLTRRKRSRPEADGTLHFALAYMGFKDGWSTNRAAYLESRKGTS